MSCSLLLHPQKHSEKVVYIVISLYMTNRLEEHTVFEMCHVQFAMCAHLNEMRQMFPVIIESDSVSAGL